MKLQDYLKERRETVADFSARISEPETTIRKIVYGQRQPSLPLAVKISEATEGAVLPGEMVIEAPVQAAAA